MNRIDLPHLVWALESLADGGVVNRVQVDPDTAHWAQRRAGADARAAGQVATATEVVTAPRARLERDRAGLATRVQSLQQSFEEMVAASRDSNADAALARVEGGTYGVCERCGLPIARSPRGPAVGSSLHRVAAHQ